MLNLMGLVTHSLDGFGKSVEKLSEFLILPTTTTTTKRHLPREMRLTLNLDQCTYIHGTGKKKTTWSRSEVVLYCADLIMRKVLDLDEWCEGVIPI